jgi:hypothetical protein
MIEFVSEGVVPVSFLRQLFKLSTHDYKLRALVSSRAIESLTKWPGAVHVFCDLDKTYLETEFESWIKMAKIPFESPHNKITVPGASEVLEMLRWGGGAGSQKTPSASIHFVSSSPPQLRLALDGKLTLDRLEWSSDTFKNQTYNLRMARIDLLRHHIAYKTKAILDIASKILPGSPLIMFGDNAEYDPFIYTGLRCFLERRFGTDGLRDWLRGAKVEESVISQVVDRDLVLPDNLKVVGVFIRSVPGYHDQHTTRFQGTWYHFDHWAQVAWTLIRQGLIAPSSVGPALRIFHNLHGVPLAHLRWCVYRALSESELPMAIRHEAEQALSAVATMGASGPSRRMLNWDLDLRLNRELSDIGDFSPRAESQSWYQSIEKSRIDRRRKKNR